MFFCDFSLYVVRIGLISYGWFLPDWVKRNKSQLLCCCCIQSTAASISFSVLNDNGVDKDVLKASLKCQFVRWLWICPFGRFSINDELITVMIGVWSEESFSWFLCNAERFLITKKSSRSGSLFGSVGQYRWVRLNLDNWVCWMLFKRSLPLVVMILLPHCGCLALKSPPAMNLPPKLSKKWSKLSLERLCLGGQYTTDSVDYASLLSPFVGWR